MGVKVRSGRVVGLAAPSMWLTQVSAADDGNWITALLEWSGMEHRTIAVVAGSDAAYSL